MGSFERGRLVERKGKHRTCLWMLVWAEVEWNFRGVRGVYILDSLLTNLKFWASIQGENIYIHVYRPLHRETTFRSGTFNFLNIWNIHSFGFI